MHQLDHDSAHLISTRSNSIFKLPTCVQPPGESARLNITTKSSLHCLTLCWRNVSLMALFTRFLSTAPDSILFPTITPSLAFFLQLRTKKTLKYLSDMFSAWTTWSKPFSRNNRCAVVNFADRLDSEFCTAFGAACINNSATSACFHAHQKTMCAFSFGY